MALRVAWFKVYRPLEYYATYFTTRCNVYELETMVQGQEAIRTRLFNIREKIRTKSPDLDNRERELEDVLLLALEMTARGYRFAPLSLAKSHATKFLVDGEHGALIPPFTSIPGLGESQAQSIVVAREEKPFLSKQDLLSRTALNATLVKTFEKMGVLKTLQEEDQLSFSFF
jgi:DNA polymerase-3 subunit alpha (Gram-positive type)